MKTPDVAGAIEGWRSWKFDERLLSTWSTDSWPAGEAMRACCRQVRCCSNPTESSPATGCTCGIYAVEEDGDFPNIPIAPVVGRVAMWGKVIRGTKATRAEYAYPIALYVHLGPNSESLLDYGVPIFPWNQLPARIRNRHILELRSNLFVPPRMRFSA